MPEDEKLDDEGEFDFIAGLQSENRKSRWDATEKLAKAIYNVTGFVADDAVIPYLLRELSTDYSSYIAEAEAAIDKEYVEMEARYKSDLAEYNIRLAEAKAAAAPDRAHRVAVPGEPYFGFQWKAYQYQRLTPPESHYTAIMLILSHFGPEKSLPALPVLLKLKWEVAYGFRPVWGFDPVYINEAHEGLIYELGPQVIPNLIQALGQGEPASTHAITILKKWGREAVPHLLKAVDDSDMVVRERVNALLKGFREAARVEKPSRLRVQYSQIHARLQVLLDESSGDQKTKERLRTLRSFVEHGSFRQVATAEARQAGFENEVPEHSGPSSRVRRLSESLGVSLTRVSEGQGVKRTELTDEGRALAEWIELHLWALD